MGGSAPAITLHNKKYSIWLSLSFLLFFHPIDNNKHCWLIFYNLEIGNQDPDNLKLDHKLAIRTLTTWPQIDNLEIANLQTGSSRINNLQIGKTTKLTTYKLITYKLTTLKLTSYTNWPVQYIWQPTTCKPTSWQT